MDRKTIAQAVSLTAWGYLFLYLNINLIVVDILPNWLGYVFFVKAIGILGEAVPSLKLLRPLGILLGCWEALAWGLDIVGFGWRASFLSLLQLLAAALGIYFHFQLLTDLAGIAGREGLPHQRKLLRLRTVRTLLATVMALPALWSQVFYLVVALAVIGAVVGLWICGVLFGLKKALGQEPSMPAPEET